MFPQSDRAYLPSHSSASASQLSWLSYSSTRLPWCAKQIKKGWLWVLYFKLFTYVRNAGGWNTRVSILKTSFHFKPSLVTTSAIFTHQGLTNHLKVFVHSDGHRETDVLQFLTLHSDLSLCKDLVCTYLMSLQTSCEHLLNLTSYWNSRLLSTSLTKLWLETIPLAQMLTSMRPIWTISHVEIPR